MCLFFLNIEQIVCVLVNKLFIGGINNFACCFKRKIRVRHTVSIVIYIISLISNKPIRISKNKRDWND